MGIEESSIMNNETVSKDGHMEQVDTTTKFTKGITYIAAFFLLINVVFWQILVVVKWQMEKNIEQNLQTIMKNTKDTADIWINDTFDNMELLAQNQNFKLPIVKLLKAHADGEELKKNPAIVELRKFLIPWLTKQNVQEFNVFAADGISIASTRAANIGVITPLARRTRLFEKSFKGNRDFILPSHSAVELSNIKGEVVKDEPAMFATVPIFDGQGSILAVFAVRLDPSLGFSQIAYNARTGETGDYYFFNKDGFLITEILGSVETSVLSIRLVDPTKTHGIDVNSIQPSGDLPYTRLAESALSGSSGIDLDPYNDYRGIPVIGIWDWNAEFDFGLAYEIDEAEAYQSYNVIRNTILAALFIITVFLGIILLIFNKGKMAATRAARVLVESERKFRTVTNSVTDAIIMIDTSNRIRFWNHSAKELFGYSWEDIQDMNVLDVIVPEQYRHKVAKELEYFQVTGKKSPTDAFRGIMANDRDGREFPVEISVNFITVKDQCWVVGVVRDITERKKAEEALQSSTNRLEEAQKISGLGHWELDISSGSLIWSDEVYRIFGLEPQEIPPTYELFLETIHPNDRAMVNETYQSSVTEKTKYNIEHRLLLKSGIIKYVNERGVTEYDEEGNPLRSLGIVHDISERIDRENQLQLVSERLQLATDAAGVGVWDWDVITNQLIWDESMYDLYEVNKDDFSGAYNAWEARVHPGDKAEVAYKLQQALAGKEAFNTVYRINIKGDRIRHIKAEGTVYFDDSGNAYRMIGVNYDISQTFEAQLALKELNDVLESRIFERTVELEKSKKAAMSIMQDANLSKQRVEETLNQLRESQVELIKLSSAVEASPVSVMMTDASGKIEYVNPKFCEVTGYSAEEVIDQNPRILKSGEMPLSFYQEMWGTILAGKEWHGEFCNKRKNGTLFWESSSISPICNDAGITTHFVGVKEDITEKKKAEIELQSALTKAEEATLAKSDFLANMSHEIRTPMNAVIGMTHLALDTELTHRQQDYLHKIEISAKSLLGIINDILDFSKIEAGKMTIEQTTFNLAEMINGIVVLSSDSLAEKDVELLIDIDNSIPDILVGDPVRLGQILNNFLSNAAKFTEKGEIEITVSLLDHQQNFVTLECMVSDTGIGMNHEQSSKLFHKFIQADQTITRKYGGTGLGLAICRQLADLMGGDIRVKSQLGKGSKFILSLKLGYKEDSGKIKKMHILPLNLRGLKVMLVDSNAKSLSIIKGLLQSLSFQVVTMLNCDDALTELKDAILNKMPYELLILDYKLLIKDSCILHEKVEENSRLFSMPTIVLTIAKDIGNAEEIVESLHMSSVLSKPSTSSSLFNAIVDAFGYANLKINEPGQLDHGSLHNIESLSGVSILLVEDNKINQQVANEILQKANAKVVIANNGLEAIEMVTSQDFDLVLMDIQMPGMDGIAATCKIRRLESKAKNVPVIAMTAHAMTGDREISLLAGMNDHITKPIDPKELFACIARWIKPRDDNANLLKIKKKIKFSEMNTKDEIGLPAHIPGIDIKVGLNRILGNKKLYLNILREFCRDNENFPDLVSTALTNSDFQTAKRLVHTLKATSGNIGAMTLYKKAEELDGCFEHRDKNIESFLNKTWSELQTVLNALRQTLPAEQGMNESGTSIGKPDFETLAPKIVELKKLLKKGDMAAEDIFLEIKKPLFSLYPELAIKLDKALDTFNFKEAIKILKNIELHS